MYVGFFLDLSRRFLFKCGIKASTNLSEFHQRKNPRGIRVEIRYKLSPNRPEFFRNHGANFFAQFHYMAAYEDAHTNSNSARFYSEFFREFYIGIFSATIVKKQLHAAFFLRFSRQLSKKIIENLSSQSFILSSLLN